jgi:hypothetical protein
MTKEQAIKIRSCFANGVEFKELHEEETSILANELNSAIEKQIEKEPIKDREQSIRYTSAYSCPACGGGFTGTGIANHCYHCGQKLDWKISEI